MCNESCILFVARHLRPEEIKDHAVVDLGVGGFGARPLVLASKPAEYVGVDLNPGPGVDVVGSAEDVQRHFAPEHFDLVLSTEMLEHVRDWRKAVTGIKWLCKPGGSVLLTTRSRGYPFHSSPHDYWRYEAEDMARIFSDFDQVTVEKDLQEPGVFVSARKPGSSYVPVDLGDYELYSVVAGRRIRTIPSGPVGGLRARQLVWSGRLRQTVRAVAETLRGRPPGLRFQIDVGKE